MRSEEKERREIEEKIVILYKIKKCQGKKKNT